MTKSHKKKKQRNRTLLVALGCGLLSMGVLSCGLLAGGALWYHKRSANQDKDKDRTPVAQEKRRPVKEDDFTELLQNRQRPFRVRSSEFGRSIGRMIVVDWTTNRIDEWNSSLAPEIAACTIGELDVIAEVKRESPPALRYTNGEIGEQGVFNLKILEPRTGTILHQKNFLGPLPPFLLKEGERPPPPVYPKQEVLDYLASLPRKKG